MAMPVVAMAFALVSVGCSSSEPVSAPPSATRAPATGGSTSAPSGPTGSVDPRFAAFCTQFEDFGTRIDALGADDPNALTTAKSFFQQLADGAPDAIEADMTTFNDWVQGASSADQTPPADVAPAAGRIGTWARANCGS